ncbi:RNA polymerase subunit sigma [Fusobacterium canifelinum]|uniref:RNA polymerase subunit sigma n=1 Tax=Fusobacterium canifelinum TaxID=285729 RepID=A0A7T4KG33_9FUSO|nr:RNA polymerase subunit sigma [Fusobacterium canifelinum]QQB73162.1 RNA polymerase subunit sigma [Fusobacterium canifelinum]
MNGEVAQVCDIVIAAKFALKTKNKISYKPSKYENKIEFLFTQNYKAKDVNEWYDYCIEKGLEDIKLLMPISLKDPNLLGFANTSQAGLVCFFKDNLVTYFIPNWQYKNNAWNITYTEYNWENFPKEKPKFSNNTEDFKNILSKIATFADIIDFQNFANIFIKAFDLLDGKNIENSYYKKYFSLLPEINARLFCSAGIADVFGGMGSWNDSPPCYAYDKGLEDEYKNLSSELLKQIRLALLYSVNEW